MTYNRLKNMPKRVIQIMRHEWLRLSIFLAGFMCSALALADDPTIGNGDIGQVAQKVQGEATSMKNAFWAGSQALGVLIAIIGINMWVRAAKHEDGRNTHGKAILTTLIGSFMFFLPTVMGFGATSLLGS